jgi:hypothetical protein
MNTATANRVDYLPENFIITEELKKFRLAGNF